MTGFGKMVLDLPEKKVTIEVRSLNSKQLDLNVRIPSVYRDKEGEIRSEAAKRMERGKVDFSIFVESNGEQGMVSVNKALAKNYFTEIQKLAKELKQPHENILGLVVKMPDVIKADRQEATEAEWKQLKKAIEKAFEDVDGFRKTEGKTLAKELQSRIDSITEKLEKIKRMEKNRTSFLREKMKKNLEETVGKERIDQNRFEQELIYYFEKLDITEEMVRLKTHCDYFLTTMKEASSGRKLGFISQEIGREINTIGSKANDADIQTLVVQMKDELEKIKEQTLNVL